MLYERRIFHQNRKRAPLDDVVSVEGEVFEEIS